MSKSQCDAKFLFDLSDTHSYDRRYFYRYLGGC